MRGGLRPGAGRKKGTRGKATLVRERITAEALEAGVTPLEYMLQLMRAPIPEEAPPTVRASMATLRFEAAKAAAPYVHPRLAAIEHSGPNGGAIPVESIPPAETARRLLFAVMEGTQAVEKASQSSREEANAA